MSALDYDRGARRPDARRGSYPSASLSSTHIAEALIHSPDNGATLDLSRRNLTDIGESGIEELANIGRDEPEDESSVERIALGGNRLATLPMAFALLSRLRYLNLKNNSFSVFPDVLTVLPSLDTLDISHNKIKRLPSQPGTLVNLRVFSFSRNKVTRLPSYFTKFQELTILKLDRNPIEWPPKSVMEPLDSFDTPQAMTDWIRGVQKWMEDDAVTPTDGHRMHNDSGYSESQQLQNSMNDSYDSWSRFPINDSEFDAGVTPHARSFSVDSNLSISSIAESVQEIETPSSSFAHPDRPPPLHLGILQSYRLSASPTRSPESYLPSPEDSATSADGDVEVAEDTAQLSAHARNASYAGGSREPKHSHLAGKKSMPDLRTAKLNFSKRIPDVPGKGLASGSSLGSRVADDFFIPSPLSLREDSGSSHGSNFTANKAQARGAPQYSPTRPVPSVDFGRNSYFRRLSTLPAATSLPEPLRCLIESVRSILFAVLQVHQILDQYMTFTSDDRLQAVLRKVLEPAQVDMMHLVESLDRFDAISRKKLPPPTACRSVVENCRDTVAVFAKTTGVLALQSKVMASTDDARYLRQILLVLHGATAEIAFGWQALLPHIAAIRPLLHTKHPAPARSPAPPVGLYSASAPGSAVSLHEPLLPPTSFAMLRSHSATALESGGEGRTRTARRHAGSFSSKDVEIGKQLPSYDDLPSLHGGVIPGVATPIPTLRVPKRTAASGFSPATLVISTPSPQGMPAGTPGIGPILGDDARPLHPWATTHSRHGSQASTSSSSPPVPSKTSFLDLPSSSKVQVDREALHAVQDAVDVAPAVWAALEEMLGDVLREDTEVRATLERARAVTRSLSDDIRSMHDGDAGVDRRALREDAHVFMKTVVQLSNAVKAHGGAHTVSAALRSNMVRLTNATEQFAILLHVSSFAPPSATPGGSARPYSPLLSAGAGLGRSRSAQVQTPTSRMMVPPLQDAPRSALPSQSFRVPAIRRVRGREVEAPG